jgi:hypothetical protein
LARSKAGDGVSYRRLGTPWEEALSLFSFAGAWAPAGESLAVGWGAFDGERLSGALLGEREGAAAMLHGPVVVTPSDARPEAAIEVAGHLVADALDQAQADGIETVFTRPQGLDRIWVRSGFIPVPEAELPRGLRGRPGIGLFGWRGGTALWSSAGRGGARRRQVPAR